MVSTPNDVDEALTAGAVSPTGEFRYEVATDTWWWSDEAYRIFGFEPGEVVPTTAMMLAHVHPEDLPQHQRALQDWILHGGSFASIHRILDAGRQERVLAIVGEAQRSPEDGPVVRIVGDFVNVTATVQALVSGEATKQVHAADVHRAVIDQAIGVVMARTGQSPEDAFQTLRDASMRTNVKLRDLAVRIVEEMVGGTASAPKPDPEQLRR